MIGREITVSSCERLRSSRAFHGVGEADGFEHPDKIPADVGLIPAQAEAS